MKGHSLTAPLIRLIYRFDENANGDIVQVHRSNVKLVSIDCVFMCSFDEAF